MKIKIKKYLLILGYYPCVILLLCFLSSCEDIVQVNLDAGTPQLAVDAWITNEPGEQNIRLNLTQAYFDNGTPTPALEATVVVEDDEGNVYPFIDADKDGDYTWTPNNPSDTLGKIGKQYTLYITYAGENYQAHSQMNRVMPIDSITYELREDDLGPDGYYAAVYARDFVGTGDCYWIRTYKNEALLRKPADLNIAYDAGFSEGGNIDGLIFITPIREGINPFYQNSDGEFLPPYEEGDSIYVEIFSITQDTFFFLEEVSNQLSNGGLFAIPSSNVSTNVINLTNPDKKAVGYFSASAVSSAGVVIN